MWSVFFITTTFNVLFQVKKLINNVELAANRSAIPVEEPGFSQPLPPSSYQRFLRAQPIPGVVIEDHRSAFTNRWLLSVLKPQFRGNCIFLHEIFVFRVQVLWEHVWQCRVPESFLPIKHDARGTAWLSHRHCEGIIMHVSTAGIFGGMSSQLCPCRNCRTSFEG